MTGVAVVVVTYSPGESLETFLSTLGPAASERVPVVLADNGSTDGVPQDAATKYDDVRLVDAGGNLGYGAAANLGVADTDADLILIANPDIVWSPGALDLLVLAAARWPRAGSLGPLIRTTDGEIYPSARAVALARPGHWPCAVWLVVARQPMDRRVPQRTRSASREPGRLAIRIMPACPTRGLRCRRRLRPGLFHVLRRHRSRGATRPGGLAERLCALGGGHPSRWACHRAGPETNGHRTPPQRLALGSPALPRTALGSGADGVASRSRCSCGPRAPEANGRRRRATAPPDVVTASSSS